MIVLQYLLFKKKALRYILVQFQLHQYPRSQENLKL